jgi:hypothetical protein
MRKGKKALSVLALITAFVAVGLVLPGLARAGDLEPPAGPDDPASAMYTLEDIYNRLNDNTTATKRAGGFTGPAAGPGSTGHTLDEIYERAVPTRVEKTGQTTSYATGDDGDLERGVAWPVPRFTDNGNGTVTDNLTGLIWLKNANCLGHRTWYVALSDCNALENGQCGLTDNSKAGDWRLPNVRELHSLVDYGQYNPPLPSGHPFTGVQSSYYWSSSTCETKDQYAWHVHMGSGDVRDLYGKPEYFIYVWPVRGGN